MELLSSKEVQTVFMSASAEIQSFGYTAGLTQLVMLKQLTDSHMEALMLILHGQGLH